jgi:hypothetical protein
VAPDGVQPDIAVDVPDGTPPEEDPVLEEALAYLATIAEAAQAPAAPGRSPHPAAAPPAGLTVVGWVPEAGLWATRYAC